jgi:hypothetical protein
MIAPSLSRCASWRLNAAYPGPPVLGSHLKLAEAASTRPALSGYTADPVQRTRQF